MNRPPRPTFSTPATTWPSKPAPAPAKPPPWPCSPTATKRRGRYLAYNRAIARDAATRFPNTVTCKTAHALAYAAIGHRYTRRLDAPAAPPGRPAKTWASPNPSASANVTCHPKPSPTPPCAPSPASATPPTPPSPATTSPTSADSKNHHYTTNSPRLIMPFARKAWADLQHPDDGVVRFDHDHYLKIWALTRPPPPPVLAPG